MTADQALAAVAALCGIFPEFRDLEDVLRPTNPETQRALIRANGLNIDSENDLRDTLAALRADEAGRVLPHDVLVTSEQPTTIKCAQSLVWQITLEDAGDVFAEGKSDGGLHLPALPSGVHALRIECGLEVQRATLIAAPTRTPSLREVSGCERTWGVVAALYGLQSERNNGLGDFEDLAHLGEILGAQGAGFLGINPVHALGWADAATISPYSPTHRGFVNTNHIALDRIPDVPALGSLQQARNEFIDYATFGAHHRAALRAAFEAFKSAASPETQRDLHEFTRAGGEALRDFALFETLSETLGSDWRVWPNQFRTPASARLSADTIETGFHIWLQWVATRQLCDAQFRCKNRGMSLGLYLDLAVGSRLDGAEAWGAADSLAHGVSLGAPPDQLSPAGQNWQLAAYAPRKLMAESYRPLRQILRQAMQNCGVLRIDHALGMNRSYWIPENGAPGGYIRQPFQSLMAIISIEAQRAGTVIVGEDLGLVPDGFRETMASKGLYGYTVVQYEKNDDGKFRKASDLRPQSLACFGTHDTPTLTGFWEGDDIAWWRNLGWIDETEEGKIMHRRQREKADLMGTTIAGTKNLDAADLAGRVHRDLATGATALVAVQLDDVIGVRDAQNLPGTIDEHPNWRRKTPYTLADIAQHRGLRDTAEVMKQAGRSTRQSDI